MSRVSLQETIPCYRRKLAEVAVERLSRRFIIDHSCPLYEMTAAIYRMPSSGIVSLPRRGTFAYSRVRVFE